jgi:hypothetical protein
MTVKHVRKPSHVLLMVASGWDCSKYLATTQFVEKVDNLSLCKYAYVNNI